MKKGTKVVIEEIARIALENRDISNYIRRELGLSDEYLDEVYAELEALLNKKEEN